MKTVRRVTAVLIACMVICWGCITYYDYAEAETVAPVVLSTHVYSPIAQEPGVRSGNFCADPQHPDDPRCMLTSFAFRTAEEAMSTTDASVKEVKITTRERNEHLKAGDLEDLIIDRAQVVFRDHETQQTVDTLKVVTVSDLDMLAHLEPEKGYIETAVSLGLNTNGVKMATAFIETKVYVTKVTDKDTNRGDKKEKDSGDEGDENGDDEFIDDGEDIEDEDAGADKKKEDDKKAKAKAEKEMMDKATAKISAKEREMEENIAVKAGKDG
ncbi:MAG: hypothetical protein IJ132_02025, partial [Firmicutes bacterium]|nr:hypothetical protein [Bacillota bacterium]